MSDKWPMDICRGCRMERQSHSWHPNSCSDFQETFDDLKESLDAKLEAMTDEQATLHLARVGISPEDTRRSLARLFEKIDAKIDALKERP